MFSCSTVNWRRKERTKYLTEDNLNFFLLQEKINCKLNSPKFQGINFREWVENRESARFSGREQSGKETRTGNATRRQAAARSARTSLNQLHRSFLSFSVGTCVPRCPLLSVGQPGWPTFAGSRVTNVNSGETSLAIPLRSDDDLSILLE